MNLKKKQSFEEVIYVSMQIGLFISVLWIGVIRLFHIKNVIAIKTELILFFLDVILLSSWMIFGTIFRWKTFKKAYKSLDLEQYLGGIGSIIYVVLGITISLVMIYLVIHILTNDLEQLGKAFSTSK